MIGVSFILFEVILTHEIGRIAGPAWVLACLIYYFWFRKKKGLPVAGQCETQLGGRTEEDFDIGGRVRHARTVQHCSGGKR